MLLIPSIDLRGGRCVRLLRGDFAAETRYDLEPHELLGRYRSLGASWLHIVDLDGARDGQLANRGLLLTLASQRAVNLQVGGGVRSLAVVDDLLRNGIDRVVVGSAAVENKLHVRQLHATILNQMGLDPNALSYFYGGLNQKLVGVEGASPIWDVIG